MPDDLKDLTESAPRPSSRFRTLGLIALGLVAGVGGTLALRPGGHGAVAAPVVKKQMYQCAMHPQVIQDHPGDCPICGMKLVPMASGETEAPAPGGKGKLLFYRSPMNPALTSPTPMKDEMGMDYVPVYEGDLKGEGSTEAPAPGGKGKLLFYRSPMNPALTSPTPMKDEMGMDYVPVYEGDLKGEGPTVPDHATVTIDPERQQLIGLKTAPVVEGPVSGEIRTVATLAVDETRVHKINVKIEGFVDRLFVDYLGMPVRKGQPLFSLYSPEFVSAQNEYLLAVKTRKALAAGSLRQSGDDLVEAAKRRLTLWDVPPQALSHLEQTGVAQRDIILRSPVSGVVTAKNVVQGARITPADSPLEITDLSHVWALADVYENELAGVRVGLPAMVTLSAFPGRTFKGRVAFVDPVLDPKTRTVKVRVDLPNPKGELKPDMFGEAVLDGPSHRGLLVPLDAVLDAGTRKVAFIALGEGRFEPREVTTGTRVGEQVEVLSGLEAGDRVITRANFLVDSESRLKAALVNLASKPPSPSAPVGGSQH